MSPDVLRAFLGAPHWSRWVKLLAAAGVELRWRGLKEAGRGRRRAGLTHGECRRVMEVWFRELGEWKLKRWRG